MFDYTISEYSDFNSDFEKITRYRKLCENKFKYYENLLLKIKIDFNDYLIKYSLYENSSINFMLAPRRKALEKHRQEMEDYRIKLENLNNFIDKNRCIIEKSV